MQFLFEFTLDLISLYSNTQFLIEIIQYASLIEIIQNAILFKVTLFQAKCVRHKKNIKKKIQYN